MISFSALKKRPAVFQSFTGLTLLAFYKLLLPAFAQAYEADWLEHERRRTTPRQQERSGGRTGALRSLEDKLVFILLLQVLSDPRSARFLFWHGTIPSLGAELSFDADFEPTAGV